LDKFVYSDGDRCGPNHSGHRAAHGADRVHPRYMERGGEVFPIILGFTGWPALARRVRTRLLTERNQEYVLAAQLCSASSKHVIRKHQLPSFTSYIIVDLMISFPYMVLSETALSFTGLDRKDPVSSLGDMLQNVTGADVLLNYQWYFIPVIFFIVLVIAFVGVGLRDTADPCGATKK